MQIWYIAKLVKALEPKSYEKWLKELGVFSLGKGDCKNILFLFTYLKGVCKMVDVGPFFQEFKDI